MSLEAEQEMWEAIVAQEPPRVCLCPGDCGCHPGNRRPNVCGCRGHELGPPAVPTRCAAHDMYHDCPREEVSAV